MKALCYILPWYGQNISARAQEKYISAFSETALPFPYPKIINLCSMKDVTIAGLIVGKWRVQFPDGSTLRQGLGATLPLIVDC
ncbi:hypothetical protein [Tychonema sp. LEGE 07203]|uniref:hypothetical protein n=1 Tax=Tychonema sp. LEGE 07203 TaxID=1828671 RepID=UPI00187FB6A0|nr:hypothetical protein [Tychonema sp. LEGE 07203]